MRGPPHGDVYRVAVKGITPAYAGTTRWRRRLSGRLWDHPRVCGDHAPGALPGKKVRGSPPRMRGPPMELYRNANTVGITPAYAGTTESDPIPKLLKQDHPRVCGDHCWMRCRKFKTIGSPPRMRGPLAAKCKGRWNHGITPAYAGTTNRPDTGELSIQDHPRVCGDH